MTTYPSCCCLFGRSSMSGWGGPSCRDGQRRDYNDSGASSFCSVGGRIFLDCFPLLPGAVFGVLFPAVCLLLHPPVSPINSSSPRSSSLPPGCWWTKLAGWAAGGLMTEVSSLCVRVRFCCVLVVCHLHPVPSLSFLLLLLYRNIF